MALFYIPEWCNSWLVGL